MPTSIVLCFLSFVFTIIPVGRTISEIDELGTKLEAMYRNMPYRVVLRSPYSLALFAVGSFLILVAAIPMLINFVFYRNRELDDDEKVEGPVTFASKPLAKEKMMAEPRKGDRSDSYAHRPPSKEELDDRGRHYKTEREYTVGLPSADVSLESKRDRGDSREDYLKPNRPRGKPKSTARYTGDYDDDDDLSDSGKPNESRGDYVEPNRPRGKPKSPARYTDEPSRSRGKPKSPARYTGDYDDDDDLSDSENPDDYEYPESPSQQSYAHMDPPKTGRTIDKPKTGGSRVSNPHYSRSSVI